MRREAREGMEGMLVRSLELKIERKMPGRLSVKVCRWHSMAWHRREGA